MNRHKIKVRAINVYLYCQLDGLQSISIFNVNNCTFSSCSVTISGQQPTEHICEETIKDVDIDAIFD